MVHFKNTKLEYYNPTGGFVRGFYYVAMFFNGAKFDFWAGRQLNHKEARQAALIMANGDYILPPYDEGDIKSVRKRINEKL